MIRVEPKSVASAARATDASETARFMAMVGDGSFDTAHAARADLSDLHRRLVRAGQGHRLRDLMPGLHAAMTADMADIVATCRHHRGHSEYADLMRSGYSETIVVTFAPLVFGKPAHPEAVA